MARKKKTEPSRWSFGCFGCFTSIFFFVGLGLLWGLAIQPTWESLSARHWSQVDCRLVDIGIETHSGSDNDTYSAKIEYEYEIDQKRYNGARFWFSNVNYSDRSAIANAIKPYEKGGVYKCYVNPKDPTESVFLPKVGSGTWLGWLIGGLFTIVGGAATFGFIYAILFGVKGARTPKPGLAKRVLSLPTKSELTEIKGAVYRFNDAIPEEPSGPDEPLILATADSRVGRAIGIWIFTLIWNAISWTIAYFIFRDGVWFGMIFVTLFLAIGLILVVASLYATLQIFNPRCILVCSQAKLYPGSEIEISWTHQGNAGRIEELMISLVGYEEAKYRQGTTTRTERSIFSQTTILQTTDTAEINEGYRVFTLPSPTMHSFQSGNNTIAWELTAHGKISWWPDLFEKYPIQIYPPVVDLQS